MNHPRTTWRAGHGLAMAMALGALVLVACSGGSSTVGACGLCDRAPDAACKATCQRVCDYCSFVPEAEVAAVTCLDTTLNVRKTDNSTVACTKK